MLRKQRMCQGVSETKKQWPVVDLHSHVLPGMDDGSPDVGTTESMLRALRAQGAGVVCATSHYYAWQETLPAFLERRQQAMERIAGREQGLTILPGAETAFFRGISDFPELDRLCLPQTNTLLLEMPFSDWTEGQVEEVISLSLDRGFQVVLAHPERFLFSRKNKKALEKLSELPLYFQINADALVRWRTRSNALMLMEWAQCALLGSDCHNMTSRPPRLERAREVLAKKLGRELLEQMDENANRAAFPLLYAEEGAS